MALPLACRTTIPKTAASDAPEVIPMKSGEASGLRARVWNIAPASPKAAPTSAPATARGSRSSPTMNWAAGSPAPKIAGTTSVRGTLKSPIETDRQKSTKPTTASTTLTVTERARPVTRALRMPRTSDGTWSGRGSARAVTARPACGVGPAARRTGRR